MNSFISIHKFETSQASRKKIERRIRIDKIRISTFRHDDAEISIWFDFEQNQKSAENDFEMKKKNSFIFFCHSFSFYSRYDINLRWIKITSYFEFQLWIQNSMFFALNSFLNIASLYIYCIFRDIKSENYRAINSQSNCFRFQCAFSSSKIQNWKKIHLQMKIVWKQFFTSIIHI